MNAVSWVGMPGAVKFRAAVAMESMAVMYETFEHTADVGLRVSTPTVDQLFTEGACALFAAMVADLATVHPLQTHRIDLQAACLEDLWHDWLAELLFLFHARRLVFSQFEVQVSENVAQPAGSPEHSDAAACPTPITLHAVARGEPIDLARHELVGEVKAVTWHALRVERCADGWLGEVVIDL